MDTSQGIEDKAVKVSYQEEGLMRPDEEELSSDEIDLSRRSVHIPSSQTD